jgi:hypothetical protein
MLLSTQVQHASIKPDAHKKIALLISEKYKVTLKDAHAAVYYASKYTDESFPTKKDVLAIIAVESGFRSKAKSKTGVGYMQIFYRKTKSDADNVVAGVDLLREYYKILKTERAAILAYNSGIGKYKKKRYTVVYYKKFLKERMAIQLLIEKGSNDI